MIVGAATSAMSETFRVTQAGARPERTPASCAVPHTVRGASGSGLAAAEGAQGQTAMPHAAGSALRSTVRCPASRWRSVARVRARTRRLGVAPGTTAVTRSTAASPERVGEMAPRTATRRRRGPPRPDVHAVRGGQDLVPAHDRASARAGDRLGGPHRLGAPGGGIGVGHRLGEAAVAGVEQRGAPGLEGVVGGGEAAHERCPVADEVAVRVVDVPERQCVPPARRGVDGGGHDRARRRRVLRVGGHGRPRERSPARGQGVRRRSEVGNGRPLGACGQRDRPGLGREEDPRGAEPVRAVGVRPEDEVTSSWPSRGSASRSLLPGRPTARRCRTRSDTSQTPGRSDRAPVSSRRRSGGCRRPCSRRRRPGRRGGEVEPAPALGSHWTWGSAGPRVPVKSSSDRVLSCRPLWS